MIEKAVRENLASLNEIVTELTKEVAGGDEEFSSLVRNTLRNHSLSLGMQFQGERGLGTSFAKPEPISGVWAAMESGAAAERSLQEDLRASLDETTITATRAQHWVEAVPKLRTLLAEIDTILATDPKHRSVNVYSAIRIWRDRINGIVG